MSQHTKGVARDSLLYTTLSLLLLTSLLTPFYLFTLWFVPLPLLMLTVKQDTRTALMCSLLLMGAAALIQPILVVLCIFLIIVGIAMGRAYRSKKMSSVDVVLSGIVSAFVAVWISLGIGVWIFNLLFRFKQFLQPILEKNQQMLADYADFGAKGYLIPFETYLTLGLFLLMVPVPIITFIVARIRLSKRGFTKEALPPFRTWRLPSIFLIFYAIIILIKWLDLLGKNPYLQALDLIMFLLFLIQGVAFCAFLLHVWGKSKLWITPIIIISVLPLFMMFIQMLGFIDSGTSIRNLLINRNKE